MALRQPGESSSGNHSAEVMLTQALGKWEAFLGDGLPA